MRIKDSTNKITLHNKTRALILRDLYLLSTISVKVSTEAKQNLPEYFLRLQRGSMKKRSYLFLNAIQLKSGL